MAVPSRQPSGHAARAIEEALGAVAAPAVQDAIVSQALSRQGDLAVPDGLALVAFVRGPLRLAIIDRLGESVADEVLVMLGPVVERIASRPSLRPGARSVRPTPTAQPQVRSDTTTARPEPAPSRTQGTPVVPRRRPSSDPGDADDSSGVVVLRHGKTVRAGEFLPVILVVTQDADWARGLALAMVGRAVVRRVGEIFEMVEAIEDHRSDLPVVLFDCANAPLHLESVATLASELPPGSWLALLAPQPADDRVARDFAGTTLTVARLASGATHEEVGMRCLALAP